VCVSQVLGTGVIRELAAVDIASWVQETGGDGGMTGLACGTLSSRLRHSTINGLVCKHERLVGSLHDNHCQDHLE
jgi:hypothetical protein